MGYPIAVLLLFLSVSTTVHAADAASCAQEWARFEQSGACYARFRVSGGGLKADASKHCGAEVPMPTCPNPKAPSTERGHPPPGASERR